MQFQADRIVELSPRRQKLAGKKTEPGDNEKDLKSPRRKNKKK